MGLNRNWPDQRFLIRIILYHKRNGHKKGKAKATVPPPAETRGVPPLKQFIMIDRLISKGWTKKHSTPIFLFFTKRNWLCTIRNQDVKFTDNRAAGRRYLERKEKLRR